MIAVILSYVPVINPRNPINSIKQFLNSLKLLRVLFCERTTISIIGGNSNANAVLLNAPTSDIKRPRFGIASASITKEKNKNK